MADAIKDILLKINLDTKSVDAGIKTLDGKISSIGKDANPEVFTTLKQQLREANNELQKMEQQFGANTTQFNNAAKKVAELKDRIEDANTAVESFNPDNKLQGLIGVASGAVTAIQGVAGAFTLIGVDAETANVAIAKLQGLMALGDALGQVDKIQNSWKTFGAVIQSTTIFQKANNAATVAATTIQRLFGASVVGTGAAFNTLKAAIASTGIGILLVGVGLLISKMMSLSDSTDDAADSQERLNQAQEDFIFQLDLKYFKQSSQLNQAEFDLKRMQAQGKSEEEIYKQKVKVNKLQSDLSQARIDDMVKFGVKEETLQTEQQKRTQANENLILDKDRNEKRLRDESLRAQKEAADKSQRIREKEAADLESYNKEIERINNEAAYNIRISNLSDREKELVELDRTFQEKLTKYKQYNRDTRLIVEENRIAIASINKKYTDEIYESIAKYISGNKDEFQKNEGEINSTFERLLKNATESQKKFLKIVQGVALADNNDLKDLSNQSFTAETNVIKTTRENTIQEGDSPSVQKAKIDNILNAKLIAENAAYLKQQAAAKDNALELERITQEHETNLANIKQEALSKKNEIDKKDKDDVKRTEKEKLDIRLDTYAAIGEGIGALGSLFEEQTAASKALNVASAVMNTGVGITQIWANKTTLPEPFGTIQKVSATVVAAVSGYKAVQQILSAKTKGGGGAGVSSPSSLIPPSLNTTSLTQQVQDVRVTNQSGQSVVRAYITNEELRTNQDKQSFLNKLSSF